MNSESEIRSKIEGYLLLADTGECIDDLHDAICDYCSFVGETAWDIWQEIKNDTNAN